MYCMVCNKQGSIYKAFIPVLKTIVYVCDECEAIWAEAEKTKIGEINQSEYGDLATFLDKHNLDYMTTKIENLGYDWDKSRQSSK